MANQPMTMAGITPSNKAPTKCELVTAVFKSSNQFGSPSTLTNNVDTKNTKAGIRFKTEPMVAKVKPFLAA